MIFSQEGYLIMDGREHVWVVIPAYNEEKALTDVLRDLEDFPYRVIIINDGSTDHTLQVALKFPVVILQHAINLGQGAALQTGISYALSLPETKYIVTFDADGQHRANDIPRMIKVLQEGGYDIVIGSRFLEGGQALNISRTRLLVLKLAIWLTNVTTGLHLTDTHNGLRVLTAQAASRLTITQNGMAHASELFSQVAALKLRYCEVPVTITYSAYSRLKGQSLLNGINILCDLLMGKMR
jgi:glycosyltransferase involved in cell wall biosynthesis